MRPPFRSANLEQRGAGVGEVSASGVAGVFAAVEAGPYKGRVVPPPERNALVEAAAKLLEAAGGRMPITSLNKALFYLDLFALRDLGASVTGQTYIALPAGPVVAKYEKRLVDALEDAGLAQQDASEDSGAKPVCLVAVAPTQLLSEPQLQLVRKVAAWASIRTPTALSNFSHLNDGWKSAWAQGLGARKPALPINMSIGMQQIVDADPWLDERPEGDVADAFSEADGETGRPF